MRWPRSIEFIPFSARPFDAAWWPGALFGLAIVVTATLGDLGELFVNRESFDVYCCGRCGRVELFIDGIGEEFRPH